MGSTSEFESFVRENIPSVWALELLLTLRRDAARCWTASELVRELRASQMLVSQILPHLERRGLLLRDESGRYRYAPASPGLAALCDELDESYRARPVAVINMIARPDPLQSLANAFKLRGGDK